MCWPKSNKKKKPPSKLTFRRPTRRSMSHRGRSAPGGVSRDRRRSGEPSMDSVAVTAPGLRPRSSSPAPAEFINSGGSNQRAGRRKRNATDAATRGASSERLATVTTTENEQQPHQSRSSQGGRQLEPARSQTTTTTTTTTHRTPRVRINSRSEQIEDPSWLTRFSRQRNRSMKLVRSIQQRFRLVIGGGGSSSASSSASTSSATATSSSASTEEWTASAPLLPPPLPVPPAKPPVSILKRQSSAQSGAGSSVVSGAARGVAAVAAVHNLAPASNTTTTRAAKAAAQAPPIQPASSEAAGKKEDSAFVPPPFVLQNPTVSSALLARRLARNQSFQERRSNHHHHHSKPSQNQREKRHKSPKVGANGNGPAEMATTSTQQQQHQLSNADKPSTIPGRQVKGSGQKLLSKALRHLDEIRGNPRPVFTPNTKLELAAASKTSSRPSSFAEVVREAMAAARTQTALATSTGTGTGTGTGTIAAAGVIGQQNPKVSLAKTQKLRSASAEPSALLAKEIPERSSSAASGTGSLPGASKQQQVATGRRQIPQAVSSSSSSANNQPQQHRNSIHMLDTNSSARQFKLQHKNQQVLQNLRRQSSDKVGIIPLPAKLEASAAPAKNWRWIASKLLSAAKGAEKSSKSESCEPQETTASSPSGDTGTKRPQLVLVPPGGGPGLRLDEAESRARQRRLSGSSMSGDGGDKSKSKRTRPEQLVNPRRSSDSEAYQRTPASRRCSSGDGSREQLTLAGGKDKPPAIIVKRNDLRQLRQVLKEGAKTADETKSQAPGSDGSGASTNSGAGEGSAAVSADWFFLQESSSTQTIKLNLAKDNKQPSSLDIEELEAATARLSLVDNHYNTGENDNNVGRDSSTSTATNSKSTVAEPQRSVRPQVSPPDEAPAPDMEPQASTSNNGTLTVDPDLLGDAISTFLRNNMHQNNKEADK